MQAKIRNCHKFLTLYPVVYRYSVPDDNLMPVVSYWMSSNHTHKSILMRYIILVVRCHYVPVELWPSLGTLSSSRMTDKRLWKTGGMTTDGEDGRTQKKPVPVPFCSTNIPHRMLGAYPDGKIEDGENLSRVTSPTISRYIHRRPSINCPDNKRRNS